MWTTLYQLLNSGKEEKIVQLGNVASEIESRLR